MTPFRKLHGAGNDFALLTSASPGWEKDPSAEARKWCDRRTGIGADGLVLSTPVGPTPGAFEVTCYNADGSIASMCGNALRCAAWCAAQDYSIHEMSLTMAGVQHKAMVRGGHVEVTAEVGAIEIRRLEIALHGRVVWFDAVHTGTEHVVAVVPDVNAIDAVKVGRLVRHHPDLAPVGTNVNFIQRVGPQELKIRTYERGVEAETLSCGSGAVAAAVIATKRGLVSNEQVEVTVHNRTRTPLVVSPHPERPGKSFWVGGPVTQVYEGVLA
jgi:diaminopimelate epimerase